MPCPSVDRASATVGATGDPRRTVGLVSWCSTAQADDRDGGRNTVFVDSNEASDPLERELWLYDCPYMISFLVWLMDTELGSVCVIP